MHDRKLNGCRREATFRMPTNPAKMQPLLVRYIIYGNIAMFVKCSVQSLKFCRSQYYLQRGPVV